jgi:hypothetical protein
MSFETWRKRRAGVHVLDDYFKEESLDLDKIKDLRADVVLVNALSWRAKKGGKGCL